MGTDKTCAVGVGSRSFRLLSGLRRTFALLHATCVYECVRISRNYKYDESKILPGGASDSERIVDLMECLCTHWVGGCGFKNHPET